MRGLPRALDWRERRNGWDDMRLARRIASGRWLEVVRLYVVAVWLYEGLWRKLLVQDREELAVVAGLPRVVPLSPVALLRLIGFGETALALAVANGRYPRPLAWLQGLLLILMNGIGIACSGGAIRDPLRLVARNVPFLASIVLLGAGSRGRAR